MKINQPADDEVRGLRALAKLMADSSKVLDGKIAEAKADLTALIARYEQDPSGFGREAITKALLDLTLERFIKDKINVGMFRLALDQAVSNGEKVRPFLYSAND